MKNGILLVPLFDHCRDCPLCQNYKCEWMAMEVETDVIDEDDEGRDIMKCQTCRPEWCPIIDPEEEMFIGHDTEFDFTKASLAERQAYFIGFNKAFHYLEWEKDNEEETK